MKIIIEGTEAEFINLLNSFGIPNGVVFDDGSQFLCGDIGGRGHRQKCQRTFKELREKIKVEVKKLSAENNVPDKPEALEDILNGSEICIDFIHDSNNSEINSLAKVQANRRCQIRTHLRSLPQQP